MRREVEGLPDMNTVRDRIARRTRTNGICDWFVRSFESEIENEDAERMRTVLFSDTVPNVEHDG